MPTTQTVIKFHPFQLSFLVFSMLLNCMGIIILQYSDSAISYSKLGNLEFFKDIPIALTSLVCVSFINRFGSKNALKWALFTVVLCSILIPFVNEFWFLKIWFVLIGVSFSIAKISIFGLIRNNVHGENELSKVMSRVEASFMIGICCVNLLFGSLLNSSYSDYWKFGFWLIAIVALLAIIELNKIHYKEVKSANITSFKYFGDFINYRNLVFVVILFSIVFVEQCLNSWLPTFYKKHLGVNSFYALQSTAFLALFSFVGRIITSKIIQKFSAQKYVLFCLTFLMLLIVVGHILINSPSQNSFPYLMIIFPLLGLFLSPLYPLYNSRFLINVSQEKINMITSLIVIVSGLGSSSGSLAMSYIFQWGAYPYFLMLIMVPLVVVFLITLTFLQKLILR